MCGREPNFKLSEEEKQELRKLNWDEFLALTRHAITNKSKPIYFSLCQESAMHFHSSVCVHVFALLTFPEHKRSGFVARLQMKSEPAALQSSDWEGDQGGNSMSDSEELEPKGTLVS